MPPGTGSASAVTAAVTGGAITSTPPHVSPNRPPPRSNVSNGPSLAPAITTPSTQETDTVALRATPTIDASMHPHLVDIIFAHADARDLLHLRSASRAWRTRANAALTSHLTFRDDAFYAVGPQGDLIRHPAFESSLCVKLKVKPYKYRLGTPRDWTKAMPCVNIIDWVHQMDKHDDFYCPSGFLKQPISTLRLWETYVDRTSYDSVAPVAHTVVVFPPSNSVSSNLESKAVLATPFYKLDPGTTKLVLNVSPASPERQWCCSPVFSSISWYGAEDSGALQELVINLAVPPHSNSSHSGGTDPFDESTLAGLLFDSLKLTEVSKIRYTYVNMGALPVYLLRNHLSEWDERHRPKTYEAFKNATSFQDCAEAYLKDLDGINDWDDSEDGDGEGREEEEEEEEEFSRWDKGGRIQFLTSAEYQAKVGATTYCIETMESPWEL